MRYAEWGYEMANELFANLDKVHATELGIRRIRNNLGLDTEDVDVQGGNKK
jgi:hypothetical protein